MRVQSISNMPVKRNSQSAKNNQSSKMNSQPSFGLLKYDPNDLDFITNPELKAKLTFLLTGALEELRRLAEKRVLVVRPFGTILENMGGVLINLPDIKQTSYLWTEAYGLKRLVLPFFCPLETPEQIVKHADFMIRKL